MRRSHAMTGTLIVLAAACAWAKEPRRASTTTRPTDTAPLVTEDEDAFRGIHNEVYRTVNNIKLKLYIFTPPGYQPTDKRPAIIFFFGGGWTKGSASQFIPQCRYFASRGMVAITADYRVKSRQHVTVKDCVSDAEAAVRWTKAHASELGIDPKRIVAGGGSAGGHLAAATATLDDFTGDRDNAVSFRPNALVLFNPVVDLNPKEAEQTKQYAHYPSRRGLELVLLSPKAHIWPGVPPMIIFHGKNDKLVPFSSIEAFASAVQEVGSRCEVVGFEGEGHGFFNPKDPRSERNFKETLRLADQFLTSLGYLKAETASRPGE